MRSTTTYADIHDGVRRAFLRHTDGGAKAARQLEAGVLIQHR